MDKTYCGYYMGNGLCLLGKCYIAEMPQDTPDETILEHIKRCSSKNTIEIMLRDKPLEKKKNLAVHLTKYMAK